VAAAEAATKSAGAGARAAAGAGPGRGGAEVAGRAESERRCDGGGPCRPCLAASGGARSGVGVAARRWSSSSRVSAATAQGRRLRTGPGSQAAPAPSLRPGSSAAQGPAARLAKESPSRPRAAAPAPAPAPHRSGRWVPIATAASPALAPPPAWPGPRRPMRPAHTGSSGLGAGPDDSRKKVESCGGRGRMNRHVTCRRRLTLLFCSFTLSSPFLKSRPSGPSPTSRTRHPVQLSLGPLTRASPRPQGR
jgi:hypothetical protein